MKKIISLFSATLIAAMMPFTCSAEHVVNPNFIGTYYNTTNSVSYIDVQKEKCYAIVVYDPTEGIYIKGSTNEFTLQYSSKRHEFAASFSRIVRVDKSGKTLSVVNREVNLVGKTSYVNNKKSKRITIGKYNYDC
ncbi:MAG: hypothetical protein KH048_03475 [Ruminococcus bicirculans]|uniref:hypothetical protein n=1 Tax=Ruminococcus bicirculans (ex Wegman et al. 2014) TaxID=1160721 RepID=UPI002657457C|nr:hypothetical protein [Ruminococcus bicirculans (ex Wegman et al. 2014)]